MPQASVALAIPRAASIAAELGLHPKLPFAGVPVAVITGAVTSTVQVAVLDVVAVLPQASVAVKVLVRARRQPLLCIGPSDTVGTKLAGTGADWGEHSCPFAN